MTEAPERIFLQVNPEGEWALDGQEGFDGDTTWCQDKVFDTDVEYVRRFKFQTVSCSECGGTFGPRDSGYSHCGDHVADAVNAEMPGHAIKYDGTQEGVGYQWTSYDGPLKGATFYTEDRDVRSVKDAILRKEATCTSP